MDIKILVATHKKYWMPDDSVYMPIQVGATLHPDFGYTSDNIGENISAKNLNYCELTALFWAWKNLACDYIGLCHYRRYFGYKVHTDDVEKKKQAISNISTSYDPSIDDELADYEEYMRQRRGGK